jgi:vacuolar-type H+-ATPase subunit I/STV1
LQKTKFISDKIAYYIDELLKFSRDIPLSQIPDYIKQRTNEKNILEKEIERLQEKIKLLEEERLVAEELCETSLENEKMTSSEIKWYSDLKTGLKKYRIPTEDLSLFAKAVHGITQYGYMLIK